MADTKISALSAGSALAGTEVFPGVQSSATVKFTATQIKTFAVGAGSVSVASGKTLTASVTMTLQGGDASVLSIAASKTLTVSNTLTFSGTDSSSVAFGGGGTVAYTGANTFTALQTITQASANAGLIASTGYSLTGSDATGMINLAGTWNTSGNPVALKIAITNTASGATSKFIECLAGAGGATSVFSVAKDGAATIAGDAIVTGAVQVGSTQKYLFSSRGGLYASADGIYAFAPASGVGNAIDRIQFGGTTSGFPALKANSTTLETKLADNSAYAQHACLQIAIVDGITAPSATAGLAKIFVDTSDGDLKIIFGDGTTKLLSADT